MPVLSVNVTQYPTFTQEFILMLGYAFTYQPPLFMYTVSSAFSFVRLLTKKECLIPSDDEIYICA